MKQIYLFNIVAWNYRKKTGFPVFKKEKFRRPWSAPEARKERSCQSYSASHIKWRAERSFHRPTFIRPDVHCCDSDLCNGAKVPMVSGFLFLACAVAVFSFRWTYCPDFRKNVPFKSQHSLAPPKFKICFVDLVIFLHCCNCNYPVFVKIKSSQIIVIIPFLLK